MSERAFQENLPRKRMSAGALFFDTSGKLLIVKPTYKPTWNIPGGIVEAGESPLQGCVREVQEELHLRRVPRRLLCVDYTSMAADRTEAAHFIFLGGTLSPGEIANVELPAAELSAYQFLPPPDALQLFSPYLRRRVARCLEALDTERTLYLEDQEEIM